MRKFHSLVWRAGQAIEGAVNSLRGWHYDDTYKMYRNQQGELVGGYEEQNDQRWGHLTENDKALSKR